MSLNPNPVTTIGITHICVQAAVARMLEGTLADGGTRYLGREIALGTGFTYSYAVAPEGHLIEVETWAGAPDTPANWVAHVGFCTRDAAKTAAFYHALFDAELSPARSFGPSAPLDALSGLQGLRATGIWLTGLNVSLEFWQFHAPQPVERVQHLAGYTGLCFETADLGEVARRLSALGILATGEPKQGRFEFLDPDGNRVRVIDTPADGNSVLALPHAGIVPNIAARRLQS